jgi:RNA polymerase sigma-70 factor (sigma-E family)
VDPAAERAFRGFAAARLPALLRFGHLLTGDPRSAEDLVQSALARTALSWPRVRRQDDPEGYVRRTMLNLQANVRRGRPWREAPTADPPDVVEPRSAQDDYDDRDRMWQALATLPPRQRAVLVLRYYSELSEAEIAETLGCSPGTVKSQAAKALAKLRLLTDFTGSDQEVRP